MIGRFYSWRNPGESCSDGVWRVICRWAWPSYPAPLTFVHPESNQIELGMNGAIGHYTQDVRGGELIEWKHMKRATLKNVKVERYAPFSELVPPGRLHTFEPGDGTVIIEGEMWLPTGEWTIRPWYPAPERVEVS